MNLQIIKIRFVSEYGPLTRKLEIETPFNEIMQLNGLGNVLGGNIKLLPNSEGQRTVKEHIIDIEVNNLEKTIVYLRNFLRSKGIQNCQIEFNDIKERRILRDLYEADNQNI